jgi:hypothetical protein
MNERDLWKVQLWLGIRLIEEHIAPAALAEQYANVIRLRINGLPERELRCERVTEHELAYPPAQWPKPPAVD